MKDVDPKDISEQIYELALKVSEVCKADLPLKNTESAVTAMVACGIVARFLSHILYQTQSVGIDSLLACEDYITDFTRGMLETFHGGQKGTTDPNAN